MKILYISALCSRKKFKELFLNSKKKPGQQIQKYHQLMVDGLNNNEGVTISALTAPPISRLNSNTFYYPSEEETIDGVEYNYLPFINRLILRHVCLFYCGFCQVLKWGFKNKEGVIICDVLNITISIAALLASKITQKGSVGIVTDIPSIRAKMTDRKTSLKENIIISINTYVLNKYDAYVFLTKQMNNLINKKNKPYVVIEGQVDINMAKTQNTLDKKYKKKVCLYAGALKKVYGLKLLADAFVNANVKETELHIYGSGDFEDELKEICKKHSNIKYYGVVANDLVVKEQLRATLLINPRLTNEEYTKYSFPSKNMEYMVSGTPVLTTRLPGMPAEYEPYVYLIEDETIEGLTSTLKKILSLPHEELYQKGQQAKQFVLENKNNVVQARKMIEMINKYS